MLGGDDTEEVRGGTIFDFGSEYLEGGSTILLSFPRDTGLPDSRFRSRSLGLAADLRIGSSTAIGGGVGGCGGTI